MMQKQDVDIWFGLLRWFGRYCTKNIRPPSSLVSKKSKSFGSFGSKKLDKQLVILQDDLREAPEISPAHPCRLVGSREKTPGSLAFRWSWKTAVFILSQRRKIGQTKGVVAKAESKKSKNLKESAPQRRLQVLNGLGGPKDWADVLGSALMDF